IVLDPFNGAGTTTKIAKSLGRQFVGIDIDQSYCETAESRLNETNSLFDQDSVSENIMFSFST
ncbi:MAG: site-specific DNA-methyltransferase, partial [Planctomycetaceae bacterium]|nr:site-specific DNA-methyltransferase [Planctomycetaceae bacterium]